MAYLSQLPDLDPHLTVLGRRTEELVAQTLQARQEFLDNPTPENEQAMLACLTPIKNSLFDFQMLRHSLGEKK